nr:hypothetical protein [Tanacetum cinerariifolium]
MATTIEQQVALDEALVPSTQRLRIGKSNFRLPSDIQSKESTLQFVYDVLRSCPFFKAFLVTADVPKIYMQEFWATAYVHQHSIRFKLDNKKHTVNLETFRDMLHICPRIPGQSFDELPFEKEILEFLWFLEHSAQIRTLTDKERSGSDTSITPPTAITTLTTTGVVTPRLTVAAKGKQPAKVKSPSDPIELARTEAQQLKIVLKRSRQETHIFHLGGSGTDEGTGSKPGVSDVPSNDSEEEISWNSSDDEDEEIAKTDEQDDTERCRDDDEETKSDGDETREEESFDPIPRTPKDSEDDGNSEEDQGFRISEEERIDEEEEADELYRDVDINQGRGLQLSQDIEDSHMTLTPVHPDGQQESSSVSSQFVTSMLNPTSDAGIVHQYMNQQMNEAVRVAVQIQTDRLRDSYQRENNEFLQTINDNMKRIIKEQPKKPPTPNRDWNKTLPAAQGSTQTWISELVKQADSRSSFNELLDTPLDFSNFIMNRLRVDTLTPELMAGPTYELMKGSCNSLTELEYHLEEVYKSTTDQLDWVNPKGQQYPHNLLQPLPLIPDNRSRRVIPFAHFINNDLGYLRGGASS